jgi:hypothetical protein
MAGRPNPAATTRLARNGIAAIALWRSGTVRALEESVSLVPKDLTPVYRETIGNDAGARRCQRLLYVDHLLPVKWTRFAA